MLGKSSSFPCAKEGDILAGPGPSTASTLYININSVVKVL
jgi:hypothetical protein